MPCPAWRLARALSSPISPGMPSWQNKPLYATPKGAVLGDYTPCGQTASRSSHGLFLRPYGKAGESLKLPGIFLYAAVDYDDSVPEGTCLRSTIAGFFHVYENATGNGCKREEEAGLLRTPPIVEGRDREIYRHRLGAGCSISPPTTTWGWASRRNCGKRWPVIFRSTAPPHRRRGSFPAIMQRSTAPKRSMPVTSAMSRRSCFPAAIRRISASSRPFLKRAIASSSTSTSTPAPSRG